MKRKVVSGIILTVFLASLVMLSVPAPVQLHPSPVTFYVDMPPEGYIPRKPVNKSGRVAIDQTKCDFFQWGTDHAVSVLTAEGYDVDVFEYPGTITAERLAGYCTLIIAYPQDPYTDAEVSAILDFVSSGHGLLFLGEYGAGWSDNSEGVYPAAADPITGPLGISINHDSLYDPTDYNTAESKPYITTFSLSHPVTNGIGTYMPAGTATLEVTSPGTTIATGDDDTYTSPPGVVGFQPVLAASNYGSGRAVVAGDHNWIDLVYGPYYDNTQLLINVIRWLCPGPSATLGKLIEMIETSDLPRGTENSLTSKLQAAQRSLDKGNYKASIGPLKAFSNYVGALQGKKLTNEQADQLISKAQKIADIINGGTP